MDKELFLAGEIKIKSFKAQIRYIQLAASHKIDFTNESKIPPKLIIKDETVFKSRILIKYPVGLTHWERTTNSNGVEEELIV